MWEEYSATYWSCRDCGKLKVRKIGDFTPIIKTKLPETEEAYTE